MFDDELCFVFKKELGKHVIWPIVGPYLCSLRILHVLVRNYTGCYHLCFVNHNRISL
jgi:hypothetical protein